MNKISGDNKLSTRVNLMKMREFKRTQTGISSLKML